jgi:MarR family 2-MHQ and catechol resistance regulon transcriptional repressor
MKTKQTKPNAAQLWIVLARCHRAVSALVERSVADLGLCLSDFMVLEALLHKGSLTISDIQAKVLLASGSMTAAADRLEKRGLVVRKTTAADRRARLLELTAEGRHLIDRAFKEHSADLERVMSVLDPSEKDELYVGLKKLGQFAAEIIRENVALEKVS